jgi:hypothetical protein
MTTALKHLLEDLRLRVDELALGREVVEALLPNGQPHDGETELWDYKLALPSLPQKPNDDDRKKFDADLGGLMKDAIAFHNAYGGYILFGISDSGKNRVRGVEGEFDCGDFNNRLQSYTGVNIECHCKLLPASDTPGAPNMLLLLVPRRPSGASPVRFQKDGPRKPNGDRSFQKETYVRIRDQCRPAANTSEDWAFLHSPRLPPDRISPTPRRPVRSALPSRDLDLVKFVGRENSLVKLRQWLTDARSPIRLITGIGGLGKTTLGAQFAEEVVATGAADIEWVIWLTAKQQTFSALRGRLVPTGKVDFADERTLYQAVLKVLSYEMPLEEDEPSIDEVRERVADALGTYSCLLIVDDIDSLEPDDQKELVAQLHGLALLTVGRDIPPSRILLTSRIDQGLPETAVVKIEGLERKAFDEHVTNLCENFKIAPIRGQILDDLFTATSGSPLFAASVVRLVKLGEKPQSVIDTWRGEDGEEVREFAFKREVQRLTLGQARLLYAVLLLGETSIGDLAEILDVTPRAVRDRIAELQAYHLMATDTRQSGASVVLAPNDLISISEIVRTHLGTNSREVEAACSRAQEKSDSSSAKVGLGIRRIISAWQTNRFAEAVVLAQDLKRDFPKNPDVASILGVAFFRNTPPRLQEADRALEEALRMGCKRPELLTNLISVKTALEDWPRLHALTSDLVSNDLARDIPLSAYLLATNKLIATARIRGAEHRIAELAIAAVEKISARIARSRLERGFFTSLTEQMAGFARAYIASLQRLNTRPGDRLRVFEGVARLSEADVVLSDLVGIGITALLDWWTDVENRPITGGEAPGILLRQVRRLEKIGRQYTAFGTKSSGLLKQISDVTRDLEYRGAKLSGGL